MIEKRMELVDSLAPFGLAAIPSIIGGGIAAAAGSALGTGLLFGAGSSAMQYVFGRQQQRDQRNINEYMYRNRYQWTMQDMRNAGLNPILAAKGGLVGSSPAVGLPQMGQTSFTSSVRDVEEARHTKRKADLTLQQTYHEIQKNWLTRLNAGVAHKQEALIMQQTKNAIKEFTRISEEIERIKATAGREQADMQKLKQNEILLRKETQKLGLLMIELEKHSNLYRGPAGQLLKAIKETFEALNLHFVFGAGLPR